MLSEFSSAAYTSCARSYRRSIGAVISNVYALRTAKPNYIDDIRGATETQGQCEVSCCSAAEQLRGFDVSGPLDGFGEFASPRRLRHAFLLIHAI